MKKIAFAVAFTALAGFAHADEYQNGYANGYANSFSASPSASSDYRAGFINGQGDSDDDDAMHRKLMRWQEKTDAIIQRGGGSDEFPAMPSNPYDDE